MKSLEDFLKKNLDNTLYKNIRWKFNGTEEIIFYFPHEYYKEYFKINFLKKIQNVLKKNYNINKVILVDSKINKESFIYFKFEPKYTFKNFFYGKNNKILIKTLLNIIKKDISIYNPIIIYGEKGCGKTHLLYAIGNFYLKNKIKNKIIYLDFKKTNFKKISKFILIKEFDVLLFDNIHKIENNLIIQKNILSLTKKCIDLNKKLFFTSSHKIANFFNFDSKLNSILQGGLILNIKHPDINTKLLFINSFCKQFNLYIPESKKIEISLKYKNINEIKSLLYNIVAEYKLKNSRDINITKKINTKNRENKITIKKILNIVSEFYNINPTLITSKNKKKNVVLARNVAIYLCKESLGLSSVKLGKIFNKDHSTILYSLKKINDLKKLNNDFDNMLKRMLKKCKL